MALASSADQQNENLLHDHEHDRMFSFVFSAGGEMPVVDRETICKSQVNKSHCTMSFIQASVF